MQICILVLLVFAVHVVYYIFLFVESDSSSEGPYTGLVRISNYRSNIPPRDTTFSQETTDRIVTYTEQPLSENDYYLAHVEKELERDEMSDISLGQRLRNNYKAYLDNWYKFSILNVI